MGSTEQTIDIPAELEKNVCGFMDVNLHKIERTLQVTMIERDGSVKVMGEEGKVKKAISVFENLVALARRGETVRSRRSTTRSPSRFRRARRRYSKSTGSSSAERHPDAP